MLLASAVTNRSKAKPSSSSSQGPGAGFHQLGVAEDVQDRDAQAGRDLKERQMALKSGKMDRMCLAFREHRSLQVRE